MDKHHIRIHVFLAAYVHMSIKMVQIINEIEHATFNIFATRLEPHPTFYATES